jgi:hypothetical protein
MPCTLIPLNPYAQYITYILMGQRKSQDQVIILKEISFKIIGRKASQNLVVKVEMHWCFDLYYFDAFVCNLIL